MKSKDRHGYLFSRSICAEARGLSGFGGKSLGQANTSPIIQLTIASHGCMLIQPSSAGRLDRTNGPHLGRSNVSHGRSLRYPMAGRDYFSRDYFEIVSAQRMCVVIRTHGDPN